MDLKADFLAMGHYCQKEERGGVCKLKKGRDPQKDQTYFLYTINEDVLKRTLFPIGHLQKRDVRKKALEYQLSTALKKDSTGLCFIGKRKFRPFLSHYIKPHPGPLKTLDGKTIGQHDGLAYYTLGQRKGLGLGGPGEAWFVVGKDCRENTLFVERGAKHPALYTQELWTSPVKWINTAERPRHFPYKCRAKVRYRQEDQDCTIISFQEQEAHVSFDRPQRSVAVGQSIVFYQKDICLGGGEIKKTGPTFFEQGKCVY